MQISDYVPFDIGSKEPLFFLFDPFYRGKGNNSYNNFVAFFGKVVERHHNSVLSLSDLYYLLHCHQTRFHQNHYCAVHIWLILYAHKISRMVLF